MSLKRKIILHIMQKSNINFKDVVPKALEGYIKHRFNCSPYLAKELVKILITYDTKIKNL